MEGTDRSFARVLNAMEGTLTASHIAVFPVYFCAPEVDVAHLSEEIAPSKKDYSHVPIRAGTAPVLGIIRRTKIEGRTGAAEKHMARLLPENIIESSTPLRETLSRLRSRDFLLVRSPESGFADGIAGIINHADVEKLPVKVLLFARVSEVETRLRAMLEAIDWPATVGGPRAVKLAQNRRGKWKDHKLPLLHYLNLKELGELAYDAKLFRPNGMTRARVSDHLVALKDIRNVTAHNGELGRGATPLERIEAVHNAFDRVDLTLRALAH